MIGLIGFNLHAKKRICPPFLQQQTNWYPITWAPSEDHSRLGGAVGSVMLVVSTLSWFTYGSVMVVGFCNPVGKTVVSFEIGSWFSCVHCFFFWAGSLHEKEKVLKPAPSPELIQCQEPNDKTRSQITCLHSHVSLSDLLSGCNMM